MAASCKENMWGSWTCKPCGSGGTQFNTDDEMSYEDALERCNASSIANPYANPYPTNKVNKTNNYKTRDKMGRHLRNATAIRVNNFNARRGSNETCQQFNGGTMFEAEQGVFSGFQGGSTNRDGIFAFAAVPQGFSRASGVMSGGTPTAARESNPTDVDCSEHICGSYAGGGRKRCPSGCKCKQGNCVGKGGGRMSVKPMGALSGDRISGGGCPPSTCGSVYGKGCPAADGGCGCSDRKRGTCGKGGGVLRYSNAEIMADVRKKKTHSTQADAPKNFGGKNVYARNFGGGDVYARNFGGGSVYSRNFGGKNIFSR